MTQERLKIPEYWGNAFVVGINSLAFYAERISTEACLRLDRLVKDRRIFEIATAIVKKPKTSYSDLFAVSEFLVTAARLPDYWERIQRRARGLPGQYSQSLFTSCNQIADDIQNKPAGYDALFFPQEDDPFPAVDLDTRKALLLRMLSTIAESDKGWRWMKEFDPEWNTTSAPRVPRKLESRTACEVYVIQQLSYTSSWMFGRPLHRFVARVATTTFNRQEEIDPERVRDLWKAALKKKRGDCRRIV